MTRLVNAVCTRPDHRIFFGCGLGQQFYTAQASTGSEKTPVIRPSLHTVEGSGPGDTAVARLPLRGDVSNGPESAPAELISVRQFKFCGYSAQYFGQSACLRCRRTGIDSRGPAEGDRFPIKRTFFLALIIIKWPLRPLSDLGTLKHHSEWNIGG